MKHLSVSMLSLLPFLLCTCFADTLIPHPPTMVRQPPHEQLFQVSEAQDEPDRPLILDCEADGEPEPKYLWTKDGKPFDYEEQEDRIQQRPQKGSLVVSKPQDSDEGIYQCLARNSYGTSVSNAVHLRKSELNPFAEEEPKEVFAKEGEPLTLHCSPPYGYPKPILYWIIQYNTGALRSINSSRITVDPDGALHFTNVYESDALEDAYYTCSAVSKFLLEYKMGNKIRLRVSAVGSPAANKFPLTKQYVSPGNIVSLRGQELELSCIYGGMPIPSVVWTKSASNLQPSNRISYRNFGNTLKISTVDFQDDGTYECKASNGDGKPLSHTMTVTVQAAPYWINAPNNTNAAEDEVVSFECVAGGIPTPQVDWYMNGVPLVEDGDTKPRRRLDKGANVLVMDGLKKDDTAVFQCNASNTHGYIFRDFYLNVLDQPPDIFERPNAVTSAVVSSMVTLRCRVFGSPNPKIKWLKDDQEVKGDRFQIKDGDLEISNVNTQDKGDYTCYAANKFGDDSATTRLEVKRKTKIRTPPEDLEVVVGRYATFRCEADADSNLLLNIMWLFNGQPIDYDMEHRLVRTSDGSLTVTTTGELDSGLYTCVAQTEMDQDEANATLIVQDIPNSPRILGVECDGLTALITWQSNGDGRSPIIDYGIQYNTSFTPDIWEHVSESIPHTNTSFKVSMTPWANYSFRVVARNKIGPSMPSRHSDACETPEDVPYRNPWNVFGKGTEKDNLVISWTAMPMIDQNAPSFFYKIFWKRDISFAIWLITEIHEWEKNSFTVPYQPSYKPYRIKVEAHNSKGQVRTAATEVIGYSGEDVPLENPQNFKCLSVNDSRSAVFSWDPLSPESVRGFLRGYKIQFWTEDEGEALLTEQVVRPVVTRSLVTRLRPFSRNFVRVLAFNSKYNGPASEVLEITTPEGTPGPVAFFDAALLGSSTVYLKWKRPSEPNGLLTGYNIYYHEVIGTEIGERREKRPQITDPKETRAKLEGLKPKTRYRIHISATTSKGEGEKMYIEVLTSDQAEQPVDPISSVTEKELRDHLFEKEGYDKLVRPVRLPKTPVWTSVSITPIVLREVDVDNRAITLDSWLTVVWKDEYLRWNPDEFGDISRFNLPLSEVWSPDLSVYTGNSDSHHLPTVTTHVMIRYDGEMLWIPPFSIHNRCPRFEPGADRLECTISVMSWTYDFTQLDLQLYSKANESLIYFEDTHPVWKLEDMSIERELLMFNCCPQPYPTIHFNIVLLKRKGH